MGVDVGSAHLAMELLCYLLSGGAFAAGAYRHIKSIVPEGQPINAGFNQVNSALQPHFLYQSPAFLKRAIYYIQSYHLKPGSFRQQSIQLPLTAAYIQQDRVIPFKGIMFHPADYLVSSALMVDLKG